MSTSVRPRVRWLGLPVALLLLGAAALLFGSSGRSSPQPAFTLSLDPGTPLSGQAPNFTLVDQFGARVSLHSFRGRVVILAFNDSECTTICPLTTTAMVAAQRLLGGAGSRVALLGIDANPMATSIGDVRTYSELHGMVHAWHFLTGGLAELKRVWTEYHVAVAIEHGQVDHTPALFLITPAGRFDKVYLTQMSYASVDQQAQLLAREASSLLPGHPAVHSRLSYAQIPVIYPGALVSLPRAGGGAVQLGPGSPRLLMFFATWVTEVTDLAGQLDLLGRYEATAAAQGLPKLDAVDGGQRRAVAGGIGAVPGHANSPARLPGRDRLHRPGRRRLRSAGRAMAHARVGHGPDSLVPRHLDLGLVCNQRTGPGGPRRADAAKATIRRGADAGRTRRLAARIERGPQAGGTAARRSERAARQAPGLARLPRSRQRLGGMVRPVPGRVRTPRLRFSTLRVRGRVRGCRYQRLGQ